MKKRSLKRLISAIMSLTIVTAGIPMLTHADDPWNWGWGNNGWGNGDWSDFTQGTEGNGNIGNDAGNGGNAQSGMNQKISQDMPTTVPFGAEQSSQCKVEYKSYYCKFTGKMKNCNVILPPNYDASKQYPVVYILHGIMGSENDMVNGFGVQELMTGLMSSGQAKEFIVVTPNMFTSKTMDMPSGINQQTAAEYDNFLYDISDSLIPFIEENYSVKTGRENRAITGFSMGGREAVYCGLMRPDLFGYVGGACPAPGITPAQDMFMSHPGCMQESEMKFRDVGPEPNIFMITGGTNDGTVGTFPKQYSDILTRNGVNHVYQSIPGGGHGADSVKPHLYTYMRYVFQADEPVIATTTTTTATTSTTSTTSTITESLTTSTTATQPEVYVAGDANCDDLINIGDAVLILQSIANPDKFDIDGSDSNHITEQGKKNADCSNLGDGISGNDALAIQKYCLKLIDKLPE